MTGGSDSGECLLTTLDPHSHDFALLYSQSALSELFEVPITSPVSLEVREPSLSCLSMKIASMVLASLHLVCTRITELLSQVSELSQAAFRTR